jgi:hypothetical protein
MWCADVCTYICSLMNNYSRLLLAFLLTVFTFNQVALAHLSPLAVSGHGSACIEHSADDAGSGLSLKINESLVGHIECEDGVVEMHIISSDSRERDLLHCTSPHGLHVPIYLDHRSLIV